MSHCLICANGSAHGRQSVVGRGKKNGNIGMVKTRDPESGSSSSDSEKEMIHTNHSTTSHRCSICYAIGLSSHRAEDCPLRCTICGKGHEGKRHRCRHCRMVDDHRSADCPLEAEFESGCRICQRNDHVWINCSQRCTICQGYHTVDEHECVLCHLRGSSSHRSPDCPRCRICQGLHDTMDHRCPACDIDHPLIRRWKARNKQQPHRLEYCRLMRHRLLRDRTEPDIGELIARSVESTHSSASPNPLSLRVDITEGEILDSPHSVAYET